MTDSEAVKIARIETKIESMDEKLEDLKDALKSHADDMNANVKQFMVEMATYNERLFTLETDRAHCQKKIEDIQHTVEKNAENIKLYANKISVYENKLWGMIWTVRAAWAVGGSAAVWKIITHFM